MTTIPNNKRIAIIGGGTNTYISNHLALSAPAYGSTAIKLEDKFKEHPENKMQVDLYLTKMADQGSKRKNILDSIKYRKKSFVNKTWSEESVRIINKSIEELEQLLIKHPEMDTPEEVEALVDKLIADPDTRVIIFNVAMVDFKPVEITTELGIAGTRKVHTDFGKYNRRLSSSSSAILALSPYQKVINKIRKERKDILLVGFKTTCGATKEEQFQKGLKLCKDASANIVFVNDVDKDRIQKLDTLNSEISKTLVSLKTSELVLKLHLEDRLIKQQDQLDVLQNNGLVTPEESSYWYNTRDEALDGLVQMVLDRSHLHFTRSTVVDSETVDWNVREQIDKYGRFPLVPNPLIPETFRIVFDWVRSQGAYKKGPTGATVGHFGIKLGPNEFLTSKRKTDFNKIEQVGLVRVITDDPDNVFGYKHFFKSEKEIEYETKLTELREQLLATKNILEIEVITEKMLGYTDHLLQIQSPYKDKVIAFGAKPSVGGQSQRSLFEVYPDLDCIVHFHCPLRVSSRDLFNATSQFSFECGSHECIASNITGFKEYKVSDTHSIWAGHMIKHGPNIVFNKDIDPQLVIDFIDTHWDLTRKTDGLSQENK